MTTALPRLLCSTLVLIACGSSGGSASEAGATDASDVVDVGTTPAEDTAAPGDTTAASDDVPDAASTGDTATPADDTTVSPVIGVDTTVTAFDARPVYFAGEDNQRTVDAEATFPPEGLYQSVTLHLTLSCPSGGCDPWDRRGSLGLVAAKGQDGAPDTVIELARFITPYHVGMTADFDVLDFLPVLRGPVTLRAFIDTWVGPGSQYGDGWLVTATFEMKGGTPPRSPIAVIPVYTDRSVVYGDAAKPISDAAPAVTIAVPEGAKHLVLRSFITGHGQGNADNCAEFCSREHTLRVPGHDHPKTIWRDDCATTAAPKQQGTYQYPRAGWCPGAGVTPWSVDITDDVSGAGVAPTGSVSIAYSVASFDNTCRPSAETCTGCTLGVGCDYDGGAHTEPFFQVSTVLIAYR